MKIFELEHTDTNVKYSPVDLINRAVTLADKVMNIYEYECVRKHYSLESNQKSTFSTEAYARILIPEFEQLESIIGIKILPKNFSYSTEVALAVVIWAIGAILMIITAICVAVLNSDSGSGGGGGGSRFYNGQAEEDRRRRDAEEAERLHREAEEARLREEAREAARQAARAERERREREAEEFRRRQEEYERQAEELRRQAREAQEQRRRQEEEDRRRAEEAEAERIRRDTNIPRHLANSITKVFVECLGSYTIRYAQHLQNTYITDNLTNDGDDIYTKLESLNAGRDIVSQIFNELEQTGLKDLKLIDTSKDNYEEISEAWKHRSETLKNAVLNTMFKSHKSIGAFITAGPMMPTGCFLLQDLGKTFNLGSTIFKRFYCDNSIASVKDTVRSLKKLFTDDLDDKGKLKPKEDGTIDLKDMYVDEFKIVNQKIESHYVTGFTSFLGIKKPFVMKGNFENFSTKIADPLHGVIERYAQDYINFNRTKNEEVLVEQVFNHIAGEIKANANLPAYKDMWLYVRDYDNTIANYLNDTISDFKAIKNVADNLGKNLRGANIPLSSLLEAIVVWLKSLAGSVQAAIVIEQHMKMFVPNEYIRGNSGGIEDTMWGIGVKADVEFKRR